MKRTKNTAYVQIPQQREEELKQFIRGSLLGDGSIPKLGKKGKNHSLSFGHGPKQLDYLKWKQTYLRSYGLARDKITTYISRSSRYKSGECKSYHFKSATHPIFTKFYALYYSEGKRKLNREDIEKLDVFGLAVWFMDDGSVWNRKRRSSCLMLHTTSFLKEDVLFLMDLLYKKWKINSSYLITDNEIRISVESSSLLLDLIQPYIIKGLEYKWVLVKSGELREQLEVANPEPTTEINSQ